MTDFRTLIVTHDDVERLLPMPACIDLMAEALASTARGGALLPLRQLITLPGGQNLFGVMPAMLTGADGSNAVGAKVITVFPGNAASAYDSHIGVVLYFDDVHGRLLAIVDASAVTAIRTAAVSGLATRLLALPNASDLAILGAGVQAMTHLEAMLAVRPIGRVRLWSRGAERCIAFAGWAEKRFGVKVEVCDSAEAAVRGAQVVCTVTASREPVLRGAWLSPGVHVNAAGAALPTARELDTQAVVQSRLYVDRTESALREAGDFLIPRSEGAIDDAHILGELGALVTGTLRGRESDTDRTLFKSLGLAVEDVAAARFIHERALADGSGTWVTIGGQRPTM
ncbi:MAG: ornithine cyclodeaminase family protein [Gemmatimonadetes bacterium]|nr:ornithine cyclodeaminase family protein [Gemmatimonadota bacterium]